MHLICRAPRHTLPKKKKPLLSSARLHLFMLTAVQRVFAPVHNTWMYDGVPFITMPLFLILETPKTTKNVRIVCDPLKPLQSLNSSLT